MEYNVKTIETKEDIFQCERFEVNHFQWHCMVRPAAFGYMGYLKGKGLYIWMQCEESDPLRKCENHHDMVCKDSAMEAFFAFAPKGEPITNDALYLNFEVNANGAMYAKYGIKKNGRQFVSDAVYEASGVEAKMTEQNWQMSFVVPEDFLKEICGWSADGSGNDLYCNFYKISENAEIEHYGSFSKIDSETPNFHLPVCFAKAVLSAE